MNKCQGTIIRRIPLTETSMIVTWCTIEHGILKTVAKGARRLKSPFFGKIDLFFEAEFEISRSKKSDLHSLRDIAIINTRAKIRESYQKTLAASYFVELINKVSEPEAPIRSIYGLLVRALNFLEKSNPTQRAVLHFEKEIASDLGILDPEKLPIEILSELYNLPKMRPDLIEFINKQNKDSNS
ncbi:MAG: DNA repair protein RecO [Verrucomicrobiales bacterium]|nr:DNA repair protein RecO [Verrucomicrobiales bacterium]